MPLTIQVPSALRPQCDGLAEVEVEGETVGDALAALTSLHPKLGERMYQEGKLNRSINIYINDEDMRFMDDLDTKVKESDEICIVLAIAGG